MACRREWITFFFSFLSLPRESSEVNIFPPPFFTVWRRRALIVPAGKRLSWAKIPLFFFPPLDSRWALIPLLQVNLPLPGGDVTSSPSPFLFSSLFFPCKGSRWVRMYVPFLFRLHTRENSPSSAVIRRISLSFFLPLSVGRDEPYSFPPWSPGSLHPCGRRDFWAPANVGSSSLFPPHERKARPLR